MLYGILNSVKHKESPALDIQLYDLQQCFDSLWVADIMNDMHDVCQPDDKLAVVYHGNSETEITVSTPFGKTEAETVNDTELQGSILSPIKCSISVDGVGKQCVEKSI